MSDPSSPQAEFLRGCQLYDLRRFADAEAAFRRVLAYEPMHAWALHQLARTFWRQDREAEALPVVLQAIGSDPEEAEHQVLHSQVLCSMGRGADALQAADEALRLDPTSASAFTARAAALCTHSKWAEAEEAARQALALEPEHDLAHHYLAHSLRQQGRGKENADAVRSQLGRNPDDPLAHANAGWAALERGDARQAQVHFAESLRLSPGFEWAREGLVQSFRARSPLYRAYLAYTFWLSKRRQSQQWAILLGLYLGSRFARELFTGEWRWVGLVIGLAYFAFAFWVWVARGIGSLLLLTDRFGRMVLRPHEKLEACFIGFGLLGGAGLATFGCLAQRDAPLLAGALLVLSCIPLACTFDNSRRLGRWLFGSVSAFAWLVAALAVTVWFAPSRSGAEVLGGLFLPALLGCVGSSWLGNVSALRQSR
ncbi:MAG: tetratricopeptide repeat protein [Opitutaceae bacterium]|nr:tetratricopeptide repeat protein [Opitutaceae bacterium]